MSYYTVSELSDNARCPCGSGEYYDRCCGRYHSGQALPPTPEALMRSRYTAFALGGLGQYLIDTWSPGHIDPELNAAELDRRCNDWLGLEIIETQCSESRGIVEFKAYFQPLETGHVAPAGHRRPAPHTFHERSRFRIEDGRWRYVDGVLDPPPAKISRNAPCPCGSGKKAKRCCLGRD